MSALGTVILPIAIALIGAYALDSRASSKNSRKRRPTCHHDARDLEHVGLSLAEAIRQATEPPAPSYRSLYQGYDDETREFILATHQFETEDIYAHQGDHR